MVVERIGPYRLETVLGRGGMGVVYRAYDERLDRRVAIKHVRAEPLADDLERAELARRRFRREARAVARLSHPSIVPVFDLLETDDGDWIVMELVEGSTIAERLAEERSEGGIERSLVLRWGRQIAAGLAEAHARGLVHRDLKAENVMIARSGHARILDFGLAKRVDASVVADTPDLTATGEVKGTARAMSPEQARGLPVDERSDLFSLGVLLYEMLAGISPFRQPTATATLVHLCTVEQKPLASLDPSIPRALSDLVDQLLSKHPDQRPGSAREVALALQALGEAETAAGTRATPATASTAGPGGEETVDWTSTASSDAGSDAGSEIGARAVAILPASRPSHTLDGGGERPAGGLDSDVGSGSRSTLPAPDGPTPLDVLVSALPRSATAGLVLVGLLVLALAFAWRQGDRPQTPAHDTAPVDPVEATREANALLERYDLEDRVDRAVASLERTVAAHPDHSPAWTALAYAHLKRYQTHDRDEMQLTRARAVIDRARAIDPSLTAALRVDAYIAIEEARFDEAAAALDRAERLEPGDGETSFLRGELASRRGDLDAAEAAYRQALERGWDDRRVHDALGAVYFRSSDLDAAERAFRRSLEQSPDVALGYRNLAAVEAARGRWNEAAALLQQALEIEPSPTVYANLGTVLYYQGFFADSAAAFEQALAGGGAHHHAQWGDLGDAYSQVPGADEQAADAYRRALQLASTDSEADFEAGSEANATTDPMRAASRALYLAKLDRADEARTLLDRLAADADALADATIVHVMVRASERLGERDRSLALLASGVELDSLRSEIVLDPELADLRSDLAYHRLLARDS